MKPAPSDKFSFEELGAFILIVAVPVLACLIAIAFIAWRVM